LPERHCTLPSPDEPKSVTAFLDLIPFEDSSQEAGGCPEGKVMNMRVAFDEGGEELFLVN
jgi:hypothetical protein